MAEALKNSYNRDFLNKLGNRVLFYHLDFPVTSFINSCLNEDWEKLELKARMKRISFCLNEFIDGEFKYKAQLLSDVSKHFSSYPACLFPDFIEQFGLNDYEASIQALEIMTCYSSSEFAVRPFIKKFPDKMMQQMLKWAQHQNHHVRRLASEGCRPLLPWGKVLNHLKNDPSPILPILNILKNDPSEYVRKSVANNLNDIGKNQPQILKDFARNNLGKISDNCDKMIKHACRNFLKQSDPEILKIFNYPKPSHIQLSEFKWDNKIKLNSQLGFSFKLNSKKPLGLIRLEYALEFLRSNGTYGRKVFKISESDINDDFKSWSRNHNMVERSVRKYYPGKQFLSLIINGVEFTKVEFELIP